MSKTESVQINRNVQTPTENNVIQDEEQHGFYISGQLDNQNSRLY